MREHGFVEPGVRNEKTKRTVAGHGRKEAAEQYLDRYGEPPKYCELDKQGRLLLPVICGIEFASEEAAERYLLASNQLGSAGGYDEAELLELLREQENRLDGTGFIADDLNELIEKARQQEKVKLKKMNTKPLPKLSWVLIGIPTVRWGEIASMISEISTVDGITMETTVSDGPKD